VSLCVFVPLRPPQKIEIKYKGNFTLDSSIPVEIEIEEDALLNEVQKQKQIQIQLRKREANAFLLL
jgi:hypothetical protein